MRFSITSLMLNTIMAATLLTPIESVHAEVVKVFFLVGANMRGVGNPLHLDTYREDPTIKPTYTGLKDGDGWRVRDDVWITCPTRIGRVVRHGPLTVGYGRTGGFGSEFGFGHTVGNAIDDNVVLIKIAWERKFTDFENTSLSVGFLPPGSPGPPQAKLEAMLESRRRLFARKEMYDFLRQDDQSPPKAKMDAMKEYIRKKTSEMTVEEIRLEYGNSYRAMIRYAKGELDQLDQRFPALKGQTVEIAGFIWHNGRIIGNQDLKNTNFDHTKLLAQFIKDVRKDLAAPDMPFIIGEHSPGGISSRNDQAAVTKIAASMGAVTFVPTAEHFDSNARDLYEKRYHRGTQKQKAQWRAVGGRPTDYYLGAGKTYYLHGVAFGEAVLKLQKN